MRNVARSVLVAVILVLGLCSLGCVERVIRSTLLIHALPEAAWAVVATRELHGDDLPKDYAARERADAVRHGIEGGRDPLLSVLDTSRSLAGFELLSSLEGRIVRAERGVVVGDLELENLLASFGLGVSVNRMQDEVELSIVPGRPRRASRAEIERFESELGIFVRALAAHYEATAELYSYIEQRPHRHSAILGTLYEVEEEIELTDPESELLDSAQEALGEVLSAIMLEQSQEASLEELSSWVLDPLPARLLLAAQSVALSSEGLLAKGLVLEAPATTLWSAVESLEGRYLRPDPALVLADQMRAEANGNSYDIQLNELPSPWRAEDAPQAGELGRVLRAAFEPGPQLVARWASPEGELIRPEVMLEQAAELSRSQSSTR